MKRRFKVEPFLVNVPSSENNQLRGIIDLPSLMLYEYLDDKGRSVNFEKVEKGHKLFDRAYHYRN